MSARVFALGIGLALALPAAGQSIRTFTEAPAGPESRPLGYPVPLPIASLTPVDGFRSHESLVARLQQLDLASDDLEGRVVGQTLRGRPIRAYVVSDPDGRSVDGEIEGTFFVNATTHAREWQAPEVATGIIEYLVAESGDASLVRYVLDNTRLVIIPVQNVDGLLQTQRFPTRAIVGQDPTNPGDWPRDGRMRRKNLRDADEVLETFADHLGGVDLNRNHPPFWATSGSSSGDPRNLVYHGTSPHSEPEHQALLSALALVPPASVRLGQDLHSFSMVFLSESSASEPRTNLIRDRIVELMRNHHAATAISARFPQGRLYRHQPSPPGGGIGSLDEYLATTYQIPAWTLELEPLQSGLEYGGTADSHSGFVLPAAEIRRVRDGWARAHVAALYHVAGPPYLESLTVRDAETGERRRVAGWTAGEGGRVLLVQRDAPLLAGRRYRVELTFSKPMRVDAGGTAAGLAGLAAPAAPLLALDAGAASSTATGADWQARRGDYRRYRYDTLWADLAAPAGQGLATLRVDAGDLVGMRLDAEPRSPVDWRRGAWRGWQDSAGVEGDAGGEDRSHRLALATTEVETTQVTMLRSRIEEGESAVLLVDRRLPGPALRLAARVVGLTGSAADVVLGATELAWADGESGLRSLRVDAVRDTESEGEERIAIQLEIRAGATALRGAAPVITIAPRLLPREE